MENILIWVGIGVIVLGWLGLAWQACTWLANKKEFDKFPERKQSMLLRRNYYRITIIVGVAILILALVL